MSIEEEKMTIEEQKEKIRERYKGIDLGELQIIPAIQQTPLHEDVQEKRVAVYVRVSTDDPRQTSSFELQKNHYQDVVNHHTGWKLTKIYADEGISGTSLQHRDAFVEMIADCQNGLIDLIVTKSVSRFARNVLDCIGHVRKLAAMQPPVGIFFETENLYTLDRNSEMTLAFIATLAQEESHNKSEIMNASIEMRFNRGIFLTPPLLGYDQDEDGGLVINEEEAQTVRLIFFMYLFGHSSAKIAETLTKLNRPTKKGNTIWSSGSILGVLQNERHCGAVYARKTWTPSYLDHKARKNNQNRNQYRKEKHHEAIISHDDFVAAQQLIHNAKFGRKGLLPELQVITEGVLKGFVLVNPRWAGFKEKDYRAASACIEEDLVPQSVNLQEISVKTGDFDLRGYQVARAQFFDTVPKICVSFSNKDAYFSIECIRKFPKVQYVELLLHPQEYLVAVRPSTKDNPRALRWARQDNDVLIPRTISGIAFLPTIYHLFGWREDCKYRVRGIHYRKENEAVLVFDMKGTEIFIPAESLQDNTVLIDTHFPATKVYATIGHKRVLAYPPEWANAFGKNYYLQTHARDVASFEKSEDWKTGQSGRPFQAERKLKVSSAEQLTEAIDRILNTLQQENIDE